MATITIPKKIKAVGDFEANFEVKGERFVVLKKAHLDELLILMKSSLVGEKMLRQGKTRSFNEFLKSFSKK